MRGDNKGGIKRSQTEIRKKTRESPEFICIVK